MKKFTTLAAAAAIAVAGVAPGFAQDSNVTSDPFVSTQGGPDSLLALGGAGGVVITVTLLTFLLAVIDSSSSSTT